MNDRERLIELIGSKICDDYTPTCDEYNPHTCSNCYANNCKIGELADYLLEHGVIVLKHKPIGVMSDGNKFNSDVYCPYCGTNLSGLYGDEPTRIIQCYNCGEFLDETKIMTREEAEKALKGE